MTQDALDIFTSPLRPEIAARLAEGTGNDSFADYFLDLAKDVRCMVCGAPALVSRKRPQGRVGACLPCGVEVLAAALGNDADSDAAMGAASILNKARIALRLVRMTDAEAVKSGVLPWEANKHLAVVHAQANLAPMGQRRWVRLVGVRLGNTTPAYPHGDTVQTVEQWTPSAGGFQFDLGTLRAVVVRIAKGATDASGAVTPFGNGATVKGPRDFAKLIADVLRPGWNGQMPGDKAERAMAEKAVAEAAARGWIVERSEKVPRPDGKGTRTGNVLRAAWAMTPWRDDPLPGPFVVGVAPPPTPPDMAAP